MQTIKIEFKLPFNVKKDNDWYISSCPILDIHSQGKTEKKARENLNEALSLFLVSCFERGTLANVLKESGLTPRHTTQHAITPVPKKVDRTKYLDVNIPFNFHRSSMACPV